MVHILYDNSVMGKLILPFPPMPQDHPHREHLEARLNAICMATRNPTAGADTESASARLVLSVTESERVALQILALARGWTFTYAVRRGIQLAIAEALEECER